MMMTGMMTMWQRWWMCSKGEVWVISAVISPGHVHSLDLVSTLWTSHPHPHPHPHPQHRLPPPPHHPQGWQLSWIWSVIMMIQSQGHTSIVWTLSALYKWTRQQWCFKWQKLGFAWLCVHDAWFCNFAWLCIMALNQSELDFAFLWIFFNFAWL